MTRILLMGHNPPPLVADARIEAAHYRTWQFLEPLLEDGHKICLCADNGKSEDNRPLLPPDWSEQVEYHAIPFRYRMGWVGHLQRIHDAFEPDCIVAVNFDLCLCATRLRTQAPIWMDIYGDYLTIVQAARYRAGSNRGIPTSIAFVRQTLQKGDVFSACSTPQKHALAGELAMAGRLNRHTFFHQFARVILPGARATDVQTIEGKESSLLSSRGLPEDGCVVLWCGGYNAWTDVDTLFTGLEWAMERDPHVHFLSIGANTYGGPDNVYARLLHKIEGSQHRERFHMLGWRPWEEVGAYYRASDVGLNIDALHYETIYGTRTRLVEMLAAGLPVITSLGCELANLIAEWDAGLTFRPGDPQGLGRQVLALATDRELHRRMARAALHCAQNQLSFAHTTAPLRAWVRDPRRAPDKTAVGLGERLQQREYQARALVRRVVWRMTGLDR